MKQIVILIFMFRMNFFVCTWKSIFRFDHENL